MSRKPVGYRVIEYAPGAFYLEVAYRQLRAWFLPRAAIKWERAKDWERAYFSPGYSHVPDQVFGSSAEAEACYQEMLTYPRVVKEQAPPSLPSDYLTGP